MVWRLRSIQRLLVAHTRPATVSAVDSSLTCLWLGSFYGDPWPDDGSLDRPKNGFAALGRRPGNRFQQGCDGHQIKEQVQGGRGTGEPASGADQWLLGEIAGKALQDRDLAWAGTRPGTAGSNPLLLRVGPACRFFERCCELRLVTLVPALEDDVFTVVRSFPRRTLVLDRGAVQGPLPHDRTQLGAFLLSRSAGLV